MRSKTGILVALLCGATACERLPDDASGSTAQAATSSVYREPYTLFESGQVRPLALSPDKRKLFACNTPDNRLEIYSVRPQGLVHLASVPVGLEPVAVAARNNDEVWVVNHLSDSVSIVSVNAGVSRVQRTLLVGDEPRDIVFAGPGGDRAFITTAHRGQNVPYDPQLTTPGIGRADVWVFNAANLGGTLTGTPLTILSLFTDTPRALAASPDGTRVYAAGFHTGNQTTTVNQANAFPYPPPYENFEGHPQPAFLGLIVKLVGGHWVDDHAGVWDSIIRFNLPDRDVFTIDAMAAPPVVTSSFAHVGTILFNMIVNPVNGRVYVSNLDANNAQRFEGPGIFTGSSLRGHLQESRITVLTPGSGAVAPRHLNKHIIYSACCAPVPNAENARSLAFPVDMAVTANGAKLYVAALGSSKIGVYDTTSLENDTFVPALASQIAVTGGGPTGLALDEGNGRLYALTRFDNSISIINTTTRTEIGKVGMYSPEPADVVSGRRILYDASLSSSHGDSACASCHIFGDFDSLAWDLGNPDGTILPDPAPFTNPPRQPLEFHPMKGPMVTQSLRGMANHGPMHWRGDRTGGNDTAQQLQPDTGTFDENAAFMKFQPAFEGLLGRDVPIGTADMQAFTRFALEIAYPPNPIRNLDNSLNAAQQRGHDVYFNDLTFVLDEATCNACHVVNPAGNSEFNVKRPGFFGGDGRSSDIMEAEIFKNPQMRNMYQKIGMFGLQPNFAFRPTHPDFTGDQVRGFGFSHDGSVDTLEQFMNSLLFDPGPFSPAGFPIGPEGDPPRRDMEQFLLAFPTNYAPIVGQQITLDANFALVGDRIHLLEARAAAGECDVSVRGGDDQGFLYLPTSGKFRQNRAGTSDLTEAQIRLRAAIAPLTFTCVPPGSGTRIAIDRDLDGVLDGDE